MDLNTIWFLLIGVLLAGYAILDGFDLGVGVLHTFARSEHEKRVYMNAIGPVWDGNEVWLLTGGGALFAAFPIVYATVFSGFYLALMLLLFALIARAVSLEFRGKLESPGWRRLWDWLFRIGSLLPAILFGVALGNVLRGIPITPEGHFGGNFFTLLNPYAVLVGVVSLALFVMHGAAWLVLKTDGEVRDRLKRWVLGGQVAFVVVYAAATVATIFVSPFLFEGVLGNPLFWLFLVLLVAGLVALPVWTRRDRPGLAFVSSATVVASTLALAAVSLFPRVVPALDALERSLTIYNASSTDRTLTTMLVIALIGMPLVLAYTAYIYRVFKGKVVLTDESY